MRCTPPIILLLATLTLAACGAGDAAPAKADPTVQVRTPAAVQAAERAIAAEEKVRDVRYVAPRWSVAVADDGSRRDGYAEYLCILAGDHGAPGGEVEIIDQTDAGRRLGFAICSSSA